MATTNLNRSAKTRTARGRRCRFGLTLCATPCGGGRRWNIFRRRESSSPTLTPVAAACFRRRTDKADGANIFTRNCCRRRRKICRRRTRRICFDYFSSVAALHKTIATAKPRAIYFEPPLCLCNGWDNCRRRRGGRWGWGWAMLRDGLESAAELPRAICNWCFRK